MIFNEHERSNAQRWKKAQATIDSKQKMIDDRE